VSYDTDIPRMVGLSGSSAIVAACFMALLTFYDLHPARDLGITQEQWPQVMVWVWG
jgi:shikimate kinase